MTMCPGNEVDLKVYIPYLWRGFWFLLVLALNQGTVFNFIAYSTKTWNDTPKLVSDHVCCVLSTIMVRDEYDDNLTIGEADLTTWSYSEVYGILDLEKRSDSFLWIMEWIKMGHSFELKLEPVDDVETMRMKLAQYS